MARLIALATLCAATIAAAERDRTPPRAATANPVSAILQELGLPQLANTLVDEHGVDREETFLMLTDARLEEMGITQMGIRLQVLDYIERATTAEAAAKSTTGTAPSIKPSAVDLIKSIVESNNDRLLGHIANMVDVKVAAAIAENNAAFPRNQTPVNDEAPRRRRAQEGSTCTSGSTASNENAQKASLWLRGPDENGDGGRAVFGANADVNLYKGGAGTLHTDSHFTVGGNCGIGTDSPAHMLHIKSTSASTNPAYRLENDEGAYMQAYVGRSGNANKGKTLFEVKDLATPVLTFDTAGKVGINTATPDATVHVQQTSGSTIVKTEVSANSEVGFHIKPVGFLPSFFSDGAQRISQLRPRCSCLRIAPHLS